MSSKIRKKNKLLNYQFIFTVYNDITVNNLSKKEIIEKYNLDINTYYSIINKLESIGMRIKLNNQEEKDIIETEDIEIPDDNTGDEESEVEDNIISEEKEEGEIEDIVEDSNITYYDKVEKTIRVGLIADRHDMPVKEFVFDKIDSELMFDYDKMDEMCMDYLKNRMDIQFHDDGKITANKSIVLYVSGLQSPLVSMIKACYKLHVNLIIKHYNNVTNKYNTQFMFNDFEQHGENRNIIDTLYGTSEDVNVKLYKTKVEELSIIGSSFYVIKEFQHDMNTEKSKLEDLTIVKHFNDIWEIYPDIVLKAKNDSSRFVYVNELEVVAEDKYKPVTCICSTK